MKRLGILFLVLLLLAGCQPTPETDAVRQKNSAQMIEMAKGQAAAEPKAGETQPAATPVPVRLTVLPVTVTPQRLVSCAQHTIARLPRTNVCLCPAISSAYIPRRMIFFPSYLSG